MSQSEPDLVSACSLNEKPPVPARGLFAMVKECPSRAVGGYLYSEPYAREAFCLSTADPAARVLVQEPCPQSEDSTKLCAGLRRGQLKGDGSGEEVGIDAGSVVDAFSNHPGVAGRIVRQRGSAHPNVAVGQGQMCPRGHARLSRRNPGRRGTSRPE